MLDASRQIDYENYSQLDEAADAAGVMNAHFNPAVRNDAIKDAAPAERSCYRRSRGADPIATLGALAIALGLIGAFAAMHPHFVKKQKHEPVVVALMELPDEPPPAEAPPPPPSDTPPPPKAVISAPVPIVMTPAQPVIQAPAIAAPVVAPAPPAPPSPPATRGPENLGDLSAKMISAKPPKFPLESRRAHEEGIVMLSVLLSTDGRVADVSVARSSGFPRLDRAALDAVRDWRWSPLMRDGNPVMVRGVVTIPFVLQRGGRDGGPGRHHHGRDRGNDPNDGPTPAPDTV